MSSSSNHEPSEGKSLSRTLSQLFAKQKAESNGDEKQLHRWDSITSVVKKSVSSMGSVKAKKTGSAKLPKATGTLRGGKGTLRDKGASLRLPSDAANTAAMMPMALPPVPESTRLFGVALDVLMTRQAGVQNAEKFTVPVALNKMLEHLTITGTHVEGLLRMAASKEDTEALKYELNMGRPVDLYKPSIHCVGDLLKSFVRELPNSLFDLARMKEWMEAADIESLNMRARRCKAIVDSLDVHRRAVITVLFTFLHEVARFSKHSRMDASNLARVFAPNVLAQPNDEKFDPIKEMIVIPKVTTIVETMVQSYDVVFCDLKNKFCLLRTIDVAKATAARGRHAPSRKVRDTLGATPSRPVPKAAAAVVAPPIVLAATAPPLSSVAATAPLSLAQTTASASGPLAVPQLKKIRSENAFRSGDKTSPPPALSRAHTTMDLGEGASKKRAATKRTSEGSSSDAENKGNSPSKKPRSQQSRGPNVGAAATVMTLRAVQ